MKLLTPLVVLLLISFGSAAELKPREGGISTAGLYVPVALDTQALDQAKAGFTEGHVTVGGVPFDLVTKAGVDNLFLKSAEWPDWKTDPSSFTATYDKGQQKPGDPQRPIFKVPVSDYAAVYLLTAADNDRELSDVVSFRIGALDGQRRVTLHDFSATVPRFDEKRAVAKGGVTIVQTLATPAGQVYLLRVPLGLALAQDFQDEWALDVEVTKELRLAVREPDPCRYQIRPLGRPSGVHIFGMTFMRSPVQMQVQGGAAGHVFVRKEKAVGASDLPDFGVTMKPLQRVNSPLTLETTTRDLEGKTATTRVEKIVLETDGSTHWVKLEPERYGYYEVVFRLLQGKAELLRRETTMAWLPPDTRTHRAESPFGTWDYHGGHFTPTDQNLVGELLQKAGFRYGMFSNTAEERSKYGVLAGSEPNSAEELAKRLEADPLTPQRVLIFHENAISGAHIMRTPDLFTGRSPYRFNEKEQTKFETMWKTALEKAQAARTQFPQAKLSFGNGTPHLLEEFARYQFPKELFDSRGNEAGSYMRMPESQPLDFTCNNAGLWMDRQILDHYGYKDMPVTQCYEICYPSTNPGNLSLRTQAAYFVRHMVHSLVWGIPQIRPGILCDVGNSYYFSNWGSSGFCFAKPYVSPKPSYVAVATLTRVLDGAKFLSIVETGSPSVYAVLFEKPDAGFVTVLWTLRGKREISVRDLEGRKGLEEAGEKIDLMGNREPVSKEGTVELTSEPMFITSEHPLLIAANPPPAEMAPQEKQFTISHLAKLEDWEVATAPDAELEWYNFTSPRRKGDFTWRIAPMLEGQENALSVTPKLPVAGSSYLPMYSALTLREPVVIPDQPTEIGLMVNGNGGWGRVIFELEGADGQRWTSIGAAQTGEPTRRMADFLNPEELAAVRSTGIDDWNTNDVRQRSRFNFEGWHYLRFPLPGNYEGEGYHWPNNSNWKHSGDGVVKYPLKYKRLIIELPEKLLRFNQLVTAPRPAVYLKDLQVTYRPIDEVSAAP